MERLQNEFKNDPQFYAILQKELQKDKRRDGYIKMLNDSAVIASANSATVSKKGAGSFKRFQGRLRMMINNIDLPEPTKSVTVWDGLRNRKKG